jgi:hypothetical protein
MGESIDYVTGGVKLTIGKPAVVKVPPNNSVARMTGLLFETDKAFLLPHAIKGVRRLRQIYDEHPKLAVLVNGHTDRAGDADWNLGLSDERAKAIAAYLTNQVEPWFAFYGEGVHFKKKWGVREDQHMLLALKLFAGPVSGTKTDEFIAAVKAFQGDASLDPDGKAGPNTRKALIKRYMEQDGTTLPAGVVPLTHGCGEFHNEVPTDDGVAEEKNRRVEVYFFEGEVKPAPVAKCPGPNGCREHEKWKAAATKIVDLDHDEPEPKVKSLGVRKPGEGEPAAELSGLKVGDEFELVWEVEDAKQVQISDTDDQCNSLPIVTVEAGAGGKSAHKLKAEAGTKKFIIFALDGTVFSRESDPVTVKASAARSIKRFVADERGEGFLKRRGIPLDATDDLQLPPDDVFTLFWELEGEFKRLVIDQGVGEVKTKGTFGEVDVQFQPAKEQELTYTLTAEPAAPGDVKLTKAVRIRSGPLQLRRMNDLPGQLTMAPGFDRKLLGDQIRPEPFFTIPLLNAVAPDGSLAPVSIFKDQTVKLQWRIIGAFSGGFELDPIGSKSGMEAAGEIVDDPHRHLPPDAGTGDVTYKLTANKQTSAPVTVRCLGPRPVSRLPPPKRPAIESFDVALSGPNPAFGKRVKAVTGTKVQFHWTLSGSWEKPDGFENVIVVARMDLKDSSPNLFGQTNRQTGEGTFDGLKLPENFAGQKMFYLAVGGVQGQYPTVTVDVVNANPQPGPPPPRPNPPNIPPRAPNVPPPGKPGASSDPDSLSVKYSIVIPGVKDLPFFDGAWLLSAGLSFEFSGAIKLEGKSARSKSESIEFDKANISSRLDLKQSLEFKFWDTAKAKLDISLPKFKLGTDGIDLTAGYKLTFTSTRLPGLSGVLTGGTTIFKFKVVKASDGKSSTIDAVPPGTTKFACGGGGAVSIPIVDPKGNLEGSVSLGGEVELKPNVPRLIGEAVKDFLLDDTAEFLILRAGSILGIGSLVVSVPLTAWFLYSLWKEENSIKACVQDCDEFVATYKKGLEQGLLELNDDTLLTKKKPFPQGRAEGREYATSMFGLYQETKEFKDWQLVYDFFADKQGRTNDEKELGRAKVAEDRFRAFLKSNESAEIRRKIVERHMPGTVAEARRVFFLEYAGPLGSGPFGQKHDFRNVGNVFNAFWGAGSVSYVSVRDVPGTKPTTQSKKVFLSRYRGAPSDCVDRAKEIDRGFRNPLQDAGKFPTVPQNVVVDQDEIPALSLNGQPYVPDFDSLGLGTFTAEPSQVPAGGVFRLKWSYFGKIDEKSSKIEPDPTPGYPLANLTSQPSDMKQAREGGATVNLAKSEVPGEKTFTLRLNPLPFANAGDPITLQTKIVITKA